MHQNKDLELQRTLSIRIQTLLPFTALRKRHTLHSFYFQVPFAFLAIKLSPSHGLLAKSLLPLLLSAFSSRQVLLFSRL